MREVVNRVWVARGFNNEVLGYFTDIAFAYDEMVKHIDKYLPVFYSEKAYHEMLDDLTFSYERATQQQRPGREFGVSGTCFWATEEPVMGSEI